MSDSFAKKEKIKKKEKKRQDKAQRIEDRKSDNDKGKSLDDMIMYVDEYGNFTTTKPDAQAKVEIDIDEIQLGAAPVHREQVLNTGVVNYFSEKGYGFIIADKTGERLFVHANELSEPVQEGDKVSFDKEKTARGLSAVNVNKI